MDPAEKPKTLADLLDRIREVPEARRLFKTLWENADFSRLLFAHREILFPQLTEGNLKVVFPFFFVDTLPTEPVRQGQAGQVLITESSIRSEKSHAVVSSMEQTTEAVGEDIKALVCLLALRLVKQNPNLGQLLSSDVTFAKVKQALSASPLSLDIFTEFKNLGKLLEGTEADPSGDEVLHGRISHYTGKLQHLTKRGFSPVFKMLDFSMGMAPMYIEGHKHVESMFQCQGLDKARYVNILHDLYMSKVITTLGTVFWCAECHDDPFLLSTSSRLSPRHLRLACPKCGRDTLVGAIYEILPPLFDALEWKDGLLGVAIGWLLRERNIAFKSGEYSGDQETDFRFAIGQVDCLLECKVFKTGKDSDSIRNCLTSAVAQAVRHAEAIKAKKEKLDIVLLVVNYDLAKCQSELGEVKRKYEQAIAQHRIGIFDAQQLPSALNEIAKSQR